MSENITFHKEEISVPTFDTFHKEEISVPTFEGKNKRDSLLIIKKNFDILRTASKLTLKVVSSTTLEKDPCSK